MADWGQASIPARQKTLEELLELNKMPEKTSVKIGIFGDSSSGKTHF